MPADDEAQVLAAVAALQARGARGVLATLGARGALLMGADGAVLRQPPLSAGPLVDTTAAGDAFRAAFAVALVEGRPLQECLRFAAAAGGIAVTRLGAAPSLPRRAEATALAGFSSDAGAAPAGSCCAGRTCGAAAASAQPAAAAATSGAAAGGPAAGTPAELPPVECPYRFASRLNSMRARRDLAGRGDGGDDVAGWVKRQSRIQGLSLVDFNHPQVCLTAMQWRAGTGAARCAAAAVRRSPRPHT